MAVDAGFLHLSCTGVQGSDMFAHEGLHELLHPVLERVDRVLPQQQAALSAAFGLVEGPPPGPLSIGMAALALLDVVGEERPILVVVEDVQWLDPSTVEVVGLMGRLLSDIPVLLLAACRSHELVGARVGGSGWRHMHLGPLSSAEAEELLDSLRTALSGPSRARVLVEAAGNPLALLELPAADGLHEMARPSPLVPLSQRLEEAFGAKVPSLPVATQRLLLLLAADGEEAHGSDLGAWARRHGLVAEDADPAVAARLLARSGRTVLFRHPLVRSAVYQAAGPAERSSAHLALGAVTTDPDRGAWHRATAVAGVDDDVADELEATARRAQQRGAPGEAARALRRAATLTRGRAERARRFAEGADAARRAGLTAESGALVEQALALASDPLVIARLVTTQSVTALEAGSGGATPTDFLSLAESMTPRAGAEPGEGHFGARAEILANAALSIDQHGARDEVRVAVKRHLEALGPRYDDVSWVLAMALLDPVGQAPDLRPRLPRLLEVLPPGQPWTLIGVGLAAEALQDLATATTCWDLGVERLSPAGTTSDVVKALNFQGRVRVLSGRLDEGATSIQHALRLIPSRDVPILEAQALAIAALAHAWRGDAEATADAVRRSRLLIGTSSRPKITANLRWAVGIAGLSGRRYHHAWTALRGVAVHKPTAWWAFGDLTEAAVRAGQAASARDAVEAYGADAAALGSPHLIMIAHRCRALVSPGPEAAEHFTSALDAGRSSGAALELARTQLAFGEWLRRRRMIVSAREHLGHARDAFAAAGARPWAERAEQELAAAGSRARAAHSGSAERRGALTVREGHVARLAALGMTNKEIAIHLHVSPRTVGAHLYSAYPKLAISTRAQLAEALAEGGASA